MDFWCCRGNNTVRTATHEVKLTFFLRFGYNRNVFHLYTWQLVQPVAAPFVVGICGYIRVVATVRIYLYPAIQ